MRGAFIIGVILLGACGRGPEGTIPGDCDDDVDNDGNGQSDCADTGCAGSEACRLLAARVHEMDEMAEQRKRAAAARESSLKGVAAAPTEPVFDVGELTVQRGHNGRDIDWREAEEYCERLNLKGTVKWRLPTREEAVKIVRSGALANEASYVMWTSTERGKKSAVIVGISGAVNYLGKASKGQCRARCVSDESQKQ